MNEERRTAYSIITLDYEEGGFEDIGGMMAVRFFHDERRYCFTESMAGAWGHGKPLPWYVFNEPLCSLEDSIRVRALLRSYAWRASSNRKLNKIPILCADNEYDRVTSLLLECKLQNHYALHSLSMLVNEVNSLTFEARYMKTLENLYGEIQRIGSIDICLNTFCPVPEILHRTGGSQRSEEFGITFATPNSECCYLYAKLRSLEYINVGSFNRIGVLADGYAALDEFKRGTDGVSRDVFVVCKSDDELDAFLRPVFEEVGKRLKLSIKAVWHDEHIEKIDERILRRIKECAAVVLVVANERFNVGLEAGYALAINKPIVSIRQKPKKDAPLWEQNLPFDIVTLNTYEFVRENPQELIDKLEARLALAIPNFKLK